MKNVLIDIKEVTKSFGTQDILKGVTLQLFENENLVILGKSGTGKSVLIKCIVNLLQLDSGSIKVEDYEIANSTDEDLIEVRKKIGFLFQGAALYDSMTVRENLTFPLTRLDKKFSKEEINIKKGSGRSAGRKRPYPIDPRHVCHHGPCPWRGTGRSPDQSGSSPICHRQHPNAG